MFLVLRIFLTGAGTLLEMETAQMAVEVIS